MTHLLSPAKINWFLRVGSIRPDGYHEIETVFQETDYADEMTCEAVAGGECKITGFPVWVPQEKNLIYRAWQLLRAECPGMVGGVRIRVKKMLPLGGGLGGGSSNCAAALNAIDRLFNLELGASQLELLGARLGSDVPFFVRGGCAIGTGRGETLEPVTGTKTFHAVLVMPGESVSTPVAYARLDALKRPPPAAGVREVCDALRTGDPNALAPLIHNDFELAVAGEGWFQTAVGNLKKAGCLRVFLCGSGSTVAGLTENSAHAEQIKNDLQESFSCKTVVVSCNARSKW